MRHLALSFGVAAVVALMTSPVPSYGASAPSHFGAVSSAMADDASSVGFDITGEFDKAGGVVTVGEIPNYVDPSAGLVMMVSVIAKAGSKLIEQCAVAEDYPITVSINGSNSRTTAGRCREFLKNPCAEGVCSFWASAQ
jgi:hypothetical protein